MYGACVCIRLCVCVRVRVRVCVRTFFVFVYLYVFICMHVQYIYTCMLYALACHELLCYVYTYVVACPFDVRLCLILLHETVS